MTVLSFIIYNFILLIPSTLSNPLPLEEMILNLNIREKGGCRCGIPNRKRKSLDTGLEIVDGAKTESHEYPWQVALVDGDEDSVRHNIPFCGASIISSRTILTAQHCMEPLETGEIDKLDVLVGDHNVNLDGDGEIRIRVKHAINYNKILPKLTQDNDFTLLILNQSITWTYESLPVCLPKGKPSSYDNIEAVVTGWGSTYGRTNDALIQPDILQESMTHTITNDLCKNVTDEKGLYQFITSNQICVFDRKKFPCNGDSGGPLIAMEKGGYYSQIGIASWVYPSEDNLCHGNMSMPSVYARVTSKVSWIKKHMVGTTCSF